MILLDKRLTDLTAGFARIRRAERRLKNKWRLQLLKAYAEHREAYEADRAAHRQRLRALKPRMLTMLAAAAVLIILGLSIGWISGRDLACLRLLLVLAGLAAGGVLGIFWLWKAFIARPRPPKHPLREPLKGKLFPPLLPRWRRAMEGQLPSRMPYEGARGEYDFVRHLRRLRSVDGYLLYRLQQNYGDDIDVTFVGPKGIWAFEVKYWSGTIGWRNGRWWKEESYYKPGGVPATEEKEINQDPDRQWRRMANDIVKTLEFHASDLSALSPVRGGIVFTHPDASYEIASDPPFAWSTVRGWGRALANARAIPGMDERTVFQILDTLLERHHEVSDVHKVRSMDAHAQALLQNVETGLRKWVSNED